MISLTFIIATFIVVYLVITVIRRCFIVIPPRKLAIKETLGTFSKVLMPGFHFVMWPISILKRVRWTTYGQDGKPVVFSGTYLPFQNIQMDIPPIKCMTKNYVDVMVDSTVMYNINDAKKSVYHTDDVLNLFYQCIVQEIRNIVTKHSSDEMQLKPTSLIAQEIVDAVRDTFDSEKKGISIEQFVVQQISIDDKLRRENEKMARTARQKEMLIKENEAQLELDKLAHQKSLDQQERESEAQIRKAEIEYEAELKKLDFEKQKLAAQLELDTLQLEADVKKAKMIAEKRKLELESDGFTPEQRIELKRIEAAGKMNENVQTRIYAPSPDWLPKYHFGKIN